MNIVSPLPIERWPEAKMLRVEATADTPCAFVDTPEEELAKADEVWQNRARESIEGKLSRQFFVEDDGKLVASAVVLFEQKEKIKHIAAIRGVYVSPNYRSKGVGRQIMTAMLDFIRSKPVIKVIHLEVDAHNTQVFEFYKSLGFKEFGRYTMAFHINGEFRDEILMEQVLE